VSATDRTSALADHLFRREAGRMVATLTRRFGARHVDLAEDVVQEALIRAMREWPFHGVPERPEAWLHRVARNLAIDRLRREARGLELLKENAPLLRSEWTLTSTVQDGWDEAGIADDQLRMMFACCHPAMPREQQVALALKTLCGFSVPEIARAFVTNAETINKRLYRAREAFRQLGRIDLPGPAELEQRLDHVLATIYLLFNEGYNSTEHDDLIREDLIEEALRLCDLLARNTTTDRPDVHALLALMLYHASRSATRLDERGIIVLLKDQDRSRWDKELIALADEHMDRAASTDQVTTYHLEAAIAATHARAPAFADTDWRSIIEYYNELHHLSPSPIVRFNRAIAVGQAQGAAAALAAFDELRDMHGSHHFHAARAQALLHLDRPAEALLAYDRAIALTRSPAERALLEMKRRAAGAEDERPG
jgi:RNA polymerase sigma factor (sigma-70 family)